MERRGFGVADYTDMHEEIVLEDEPLGMWRGNRL
jgi:hypothetical protein